MRRVLPSSLSIAVLLCAQAGLAQSAPSPAVIGEVHSPDATVHGAVIVGTSGTGIMSGSQITAGNSNAGLELKRGGTLQVCGGSSVTITSANNGREMLLALNIGTLETHYTLPANSDTMITPDFRLTLTGPGAFDFAVGTSGKNDLCIRSLTGNASSLIVNEQFGDGAHQVKPGEQIIFHNGRVDDFSPDASSCGCPQSMHEIVKKNAPPGLAFPEQQSRRAEAAAAAGLPPPADPGIPVSTSEAAKPGQVYTQIDAPVVFRAEDVPPPVPSVDLRKLPPWPAAAMLPSAQPPAKKRWYQRFGSALSSIFGKKTK